MSMGLDSGLTRHGTMTDMKTAVSWKVIVFCGNRQADMSPTDAYQRHSSQQITCDSV